MGGFGAGRVAGRWWTMIRRRWAGSGGFGLSLALGITAWVWLNAWFCRSDGFIRRVGVPGCGGIKTVACGNNVAVLVWCRGQSSTFPSAGKSFNARRFTARSGGGEELCCHLSRFAPGLP
ncbi:hypothetical protein KCP76_00670 [Salmonella enterica subsp. enterica serovar Weltevreden]|nr:hypothetical protein KCP76_00670 [Salmonella enterica subsp. enterica serovar Weltevreden]